MLYHGMTCNPGSAKVCSSAIIETCFFHDKDVWVAVDDFYMYFYLTVLFLLIAIIQLMNFTAL